jgi:hypothetical protein
MRVDSTFFLWLIQDPVNRREKLALISTLLWSITKEAFRPQPEV